MKIDNSSSSISTFHRRKRQRQSPCWTIRIIGLSLFALLLLFISNENLTKHDENSTSYSTDNNFSDESRRCEVLFTASPGELSRMKTLNLNGCNLTQIPDSIRFCTNLLHLDVSNNPKLTTLPKDIIKCKKLDTLFVSSCPGIKTLPVILGEMGSIARLGWRSGSLTSIDAKALPPNLIHLILTDNDIRRLDDPLLFKKLGKVRKLMLSHNKIESFGGYSVNGSNDESFISDMKNLELLRLGGNRIQYIHDDLWSLPKLTWLTISGNPMTNKFKSQALSNIPLKNKVPIATMKELQTTGEYLGKGASGKVELYNWTRRSDNNEFGQVPVALKLIHGVTSDGNAEDELAVYMTVGSKLEGGMKAQHVVGCLAIMEDHDINDPSQIKSGVLMERLPSHLDDLAMPPTIVEVTADRWKDGLSFSPSFVMNAMEDAAHALHFLHSEVGVAHGDFYAHNIKVDWNTGAVNLLDFGASYFKGTYSVQAEKLEVRAFGIYMRELLDLLEMRVGEHKSDEGKADIHRESSQEGPQDVIFHRTLMALSSQCMDKDVGNRPTFSNLKQILNKKRATFSISLNLEKN
jgi:hypothetical protein